MEKTVKITGFEEKEGTKGTYWKVSTSPALIPKKGVFIHDEGQIQALEKDKFYNFTYSTNEKGFINIEGFEEVVDVNEDMIKEKPASRGDGKNRAFALAYAKDAVKEIYSAKIGAKQEVPELDKMANDIMLMAKSFVDFLEQ